MNQFHITGKVIHIGNRNEDGCGLTITHYPDTISDGYFDMGIVIPNDIWLNCDIRTYDFLEVKGYYMTINRTINPKKAKLVHVVNEIVKVEHEQ